MTTGTCRLQVAAVSTSDECVSVCVCLCVCVCLSVNSTDTDQSQSTCLSSADWPPWLSVRSLGHSLPQPVRRCVNGHYTSLVIYYDDHTVDQQSTVNKTIRLTLAHSILTDLFWFRLRLNYSTSEWWRQ